MAKFGHFLLAGTLVSVVGCSIGLLGYALTPADDYRAILGWVLLAVGFGLALFVILAMLRISWQYLLMLYLIREHPERYLEIQRQFRRLLERPDASAAEEQESAVGNTGTNKDGGPKPAEGISPEAGPSPTPGPP
ncbi:MAG: hypothetical protein KatS3mg105_3119 [Gemmatales bacterium]|nr:MAG: hypothetical protein KatS3mg105_3119 [Gemmatales bacterium]